MYIKDEWSMDNKEKVYKAQRFRRMWDEGVKRGGTKKIRRKMNNMDLVPTFLQGIQKKICFLLRFPRIFNIILGLYTKGDQRAVSKKKCMKFWKEVV